MRQSIEKKYENLIKNAHQYLCYMYLISYNYQKCILHGNALLNFKSLSPTTKYNLHVYISEAKCMLGQFTDALVHLDAAEEISTNGAGEGSSLQDTVIQNLVTQVEHKFRVINVKKEGSAGSAPSADRAPTEVLTLKMINKLNKCVVELCQGNFEGARAKFDEVITNSEENGGLGLKEITCETDSHQMLPGYLATLLSYFYLRVKNFKMARSMAKYHRFVVDSDHIVQQVKPNQPEKQQTGKYSKKQQPQMNYKSIGKNFTSFESS